MSDPNDYTKVQIYFGEQKPLLDRASKLALKTKGVSISGLVVAALACCIDTFEKEIPRKRRFKCCDKLIVI